MRWKLFVGLVASLVVLGGLGLWGVNKGLWRFNEPDAARFPLWGVDVSHHQGEIDWPTLAAQPPLAFAYIKATEGGDWVDSRFKSNWKQAREAGLRVGAYHFFTFCRPPLEQAVHFLANLPDDVDTLPPAVDVEFGGNCSTSKSQLEIRQDLSVWLKTVEAATARRPVAYVTPDSYEAFFQGTPQEADLWVRSLWGEPDLPPTTGWAFWQFAHRGHLAGVTGPVDLNVFSGDRSSLERLSVRRKPRNEACPPQFGGDCGPPEKQKQVP